MKLFWYFLTILVFTISCEDNEEPTSFLDLEWIQFQYSELDSIPLIVYTDSTSLCPNGSIASGCYIATDSVALNPDDYYYWYYYYYFDIAWGDGSDTLYYVYTDSSAIFEYTDSTTVWNYIEAYFNIYKLNSSQDNFPTGSETLACKFIHYYQDESYFEYELTSETSIRSLDVSSFKNITFKIK